MRKSRDCNPGGLSRGEMGFYGDFRSSSAEGCAGQRHRQRLHGYVAVVM